MTSSRSACPALRRLALGTVQFGTAYGISNPRGQVATADARAILEDAGARGLDLLDTAPGYGEAERVLGGLRPLTDRFGIVTKTARLAGAGVDGVVARARESLKKLGRERAEGLLVHRAGDLCDPEGAALWRALLELRDGGLYDRIGISAYAEDDPLDLARRFRPELMQIPLSVLDQRLVRDGTLSRLADLGVEVHVRSIFLQGLVFLDPARLPARLAHAAPLLRDRARRIAEGGTSPLTAALHFALARPDVARIVVGVTSLAEWREVAGAAQGPAPDLDWDALAIDDVRVLNPAGW